MGFVRKALEQEFPVPADTVLYSWLPIASGQDSEAVTAYDGFVREVHGGNDDFDQIRDLRNAIRSLRE